MREWVNGYRQLVIRLERKLNELEQYLLKLSE